MTNVDWSLVCPACRADLGTLDESNECIVCQRCGTAYQWYDGVWSFLPPERADYFAPFLRDYTTIRQREGRGFESSVHCLALPHCPPDDPLAWQWRMRATSFEYVLRRVFGERVGLRVLDLGAGVGWLSHRLSSLGHYPCAVDITTDGNDGLGAGRHYSPDWPRLQAEFDRLPLANEQADVVIFNASIHYSGDYRTTLAEALRVLRPNGQIVVMDSPMYRADAAGRQMVVERQAAFEQRYGTRSDAMPTIGYLTWTMLDELAHHFGLRWQVIRPWYGWRWALRPLRARIQGTREPSTFAILVGQRRLFTTKKQR